MAIEYTAISGHGIKISSEKMVELKQTAIQLAFDIIKVRDGGGDIKEIYTLANEIVRWSVIVENKDLCISD